MPLVFWPDFLSMLALQLVSGVFVACSSILASPLLNSSGDRGGKLAVLVVKRNVVGHQRGIDASACLNMMIFRVVQYLRNKNRHDKIRRYVTLGKNGRRCTRKFLKETKRKRTEFLGSFKLNNINCTSWANSNRAENGIFYKDSII